MNAIVLLIPLLLIRFLLLGILDKNSLKRAASFAPVIGNEKVAYLLYQISNTVFFLYVFFLKITSDTVWLYAGTGIFALGILLCIWSVIDFAKPTQNGLNRIGIYRISRNPMYIAYFVYFLGCVLMTQSIILFGILLVFQISAHWIIKSEERWCVQEFGQEYIDYMKKVRRYI